MDLIISILEQGLIFSLMALGVYITYKILDFPDLSVDGTFALGASVTAAILVKGINPVVATSVSIVAGCIGGIVTGILHVKFKITNLLSGILVMTALYSVNLRIMGKSNIPLFNQNTVFNINIDTIYIILVMAFLVKILLDLFLRTKLGFVLKACGDNEKLITSLGIDIGNIKIIGLMISNGLVALSGSLLAQYQGFSDVTMGSGIIVMGLASVIFGEAVLKKFSFIKTTTMAVIGSILYKLSTALALKIGFNPTDLKLITALIVVVAIATNNSKFKLNLNFIKRGETNDSNKKLMQNVQ
ncbi:MAG: ABC transporter permease [Tepidibacter sp.]|jgi:putative ABC transport system permease protein|uniref:ABC transporter permease n=1 Tax=Tepidibacter sp. TaxID=2529387 RepID=UPI0025EE27CB|nr:ABC transporter permease [Tepidibacter sp.]MCT4507337.1 ABC transporter permease [Tepidibacter sp.]